MELLKWKWVFLPTNAQSSAWNEQLWLWILTMISVTLRNSDAITTQLLIYIVETKWDTCYTSFFIDSFQQQKYSLTRKIIHNWSIDILKNIKMMKVGKIKINGGAISGWVGAALYANSR